MKSRQFTTSWREIKIMNKQTSSTQNFPEEGNPFERGVSEIPENLVPPVAPTTPPPKYAPVQKIMIALQSNHEAETASARAQFAQMQGDINRLREQLATANARIGELQRRLDSR